jgi:glycosyltransferase involved in cell wall biosynthesis
MKIALLTTDNRENERDYSRAEPSFGTAPEALLRGFRELDHLEVHVISCLKREVAAPKRLAPNIYYHAVVVPSIGWLKTGYLGCIRAVRRKLRDIRPDIVHGQGTERDCAISAAFSGYPNVVTLHGNMRLVAKLENAKPWSYLGLTATLENIVLRKTDGIVCISTYTKENVQALSRRTWIIPNAVDPSFFEIQRKPLDPPTIVCVGLICPRKNQNAFIEALVPLREKRDFRLVFLGKAPSGSGYSEVFLSLVRQYSWIERRGFLGREGLREELVKASLLALPSLEDNCPMVILEAVAAGVPVVASRVGGIPDLIEHEVNGLLFDPTDPCSIRESVRAALANRSQSQSLAETGKLLAKKRFHPVSVAEQHLAIYREVLSRRSYSDVHAN